MFVSVIKFLCYLPFSFCFHLSSTSIRNSPSLFLLSDHLYPVVVSNIFIVMLPYSLLLQYLPPSGTPFPIAPIRSIVSCYLPSRSSHLLSYLLPSTFLRSTCCTNLIGLRNKTLVTNIRE